MMEITELMKKHNLGDVDAIDKEGNTSVHLAIKNKKLSQEEIIEILKVLLDKDIDVNVENQRKQTPLHLAVTNRMKDVVEFLSERKANFGTVTHFYIEDEYEKFRRLSDTMYSYRNSDLHDKEKQRMETESIHFVEWLISKGFDFDCKNEKNQSALHLAIDHSLQHILPVLLKSTKDIDAVNEKNNTLLHTFLERNARQYEYSVVRTKWYSDRYAADIVKILLDRGSSSSQVNAKDKTGLSPLHLAANFRASVVQTLIEYGADVNSRNNQKETPLHIAMNNSQNPCILEIAKLLLEHGANVNATNCRGLTALHVMAEQRFGPRTEYSVSAVKILLQHGADVNVLAEKKYSVLSYARYGDRVDYKRACNKIIMEHNSRQPVYYDDEDRPTFDNAMSMEDCPLEEWASGVLRMLTDHSVALKAVGLPWAREHESWVRFCNTATIETDEYEESYEDCLTEVKKLKKSFIYNRVSIYDFLRMDPNSKCAYINNEKLQQLIQSPEFEDKFPKYCILILAGYHEAVRRKALLEPAKEAWLNLTKIALPDICVERILAYLSNADLFDMIERD